MPRRSRTPRRRWTPFKKAEYEPLTRIDELEQLGKEGLLDQSLKSCRKKEKREAVAKGVVRNPPGNPPAATSLR